MTKGSMDSPKTNIYKELLQKRAAAQAAGRQHGTTGVLANSDLSRKFAAGEKAQPIIRRGGRNGSGKP